MILNALYKLYNRLESDPNERENIPSRSSSKIKVNYALVINKEGKLIAINLIGNAEKAKVQSKKLFVPYQLDDSGGIRERFLCGKAKYLLGVDSKDSKLYEAYFEATKKLHHAIGDKLTNNSEMQAVIKFFDNWLPEQALENNIIKEKWDDLVKNPASLVFEVEMGESLYVHENEEIKEAFKQDYEQKFSGSDVTKGTCLISGKEDMPLVRLHEKIKGVAGAQPTGANLVSYNDTIFESYGLKGGENAKISGETAFNYAAALNYLLSNSKRYTRAGSTTFVYWSEIKDPAEDEIDLIIEAEETALDNLLAEYSQLKQNKVTLKARDNQAFYILALIPAAGRLGIRFFLESNVDKLKMSIASHYQDIALGTPPDEPAKDEERKPIKAKSGKDGTKKIKQYVGLYKLMDSLVSQNIKKNRSEAIDDNLAGKIAYAIFSGINYPQNLLVAVIRAIKADGQVTRPRASIIKGVLVRNYDKREEINKVLNEQLDDVGYLCGRLFAVLEATQNKAIGGGTTIADKYLATAASTPVRVFPQLLNLNQHHKSKIGGGLAVNIDKELQEIFNLFKEGMNFPKTLSTEGQGLFYIGYYQEKAAVWQRLKSAKPADINPTEEGAN
ncbi:MAG: type I-C CRISPR-associated protein Cas8c/Csd1 [Spirochaetaceae bacterium]|nr:type I-C CRISPR-associated protein Cas8c/Csd1 [Spirochaetaceae bacterium]